MRKPFHLDAKFTPSLSSVCARLCVCAHVHVCVCVHAGCMHDDHGLPALLLPGLVLLGADGGVAVLHGRDGEGSDPTHTQTIPVSRMG